MKTSDNPDEYPSGAFLYLVVPHFVVENKSCETTAKTKKHIAVVVTRLINQQANHCKDQKHIAVVGSALVNNSGNHCKDQKRNAVVRSLLINYNENHCKNQKLVWQRALLFFKVIPDAYKGEGGY